MLQELLNEAGYETRSYSGRNMYGKECLAIVTDNNLAYVLCSLFESDSCLNYNPIRTKTLLQILRNTKTDNMGRSMVYYWPNIAYEG